MPTVIDPVMINDLLRWSLILEVAFAGIGFVILIIQTVALLNIAEELRKMREKP